MTAEETAPAGQPAGRETFGALLRRHREAAGLTQEALAELAGLSARGISDLERGIRIRPHLETLRLLAEALGLGPADRAALVAARFQATAAIPLPERRGSGDSL